MHLITYAIECILIVHQVRFLFNIEILLIGASVANSTENRRNGSNVTIEDTALLNRNYGTLIRNQKIGGLNRKDVNEMLFQTKGETKQDLPNLVFFYLYTRSNPTNPDRLILNANALRRSNFNPGRPTVIGTHGWRSSANAEACTLIRDGTCH